MANAPHAHKGWAHLQRSVNQKWHPSLVLSQQFTRASLRKLGKVHKVTG